MKRKDNRRVEEISEIVPGDPFGAQTVEDKTQYRVVFPTTQNEDFVYTASSRIRGLAAAIRGD